MTQSAPNSNASNHQWAGARWKIRRPFQKWRGEPTQNAPKKNRRPKQKKISTENTFANRSHRHGNPCIWRLPFDKDILPSTFLFPPHQLLLISGHSAGLFADWWKEKSFFFFFFYIVQSRRAHKQIMTIVVRAHRNRYDIFLYLTPNKKMLFFWWRS